MMRLSRISRHAQQRKFPSSSSSLRIGGARGQTQTSLMMNPQTPAAALSVESRRFCSTNAAANEDDGTTAKLKPEDGSEINEFPVVQLPARSLWCEQQKVALSDIGKPGFNRKLQFLIDTRKYYQYPSMSAPQIGWNEAIFTLPPKDSSGGGSDSVWINPKIERLYSDTMAWTWEPCASCCFLMHYIERPLQCVISGYDERGRYRSEEMTGMRSRMAQHEMDHMNGVLFTRRIPDPFHVVPMMGFHSMSDWSDDFPSLEARSTNLYTIFTPPLKFTPEFIADAKLLSRHAEEGIYPNHETYEAIRVEEEKSQAALLQFAKIRDGKASAPEGEAEKDSTTAAEGGAA